MMVAGPWWCSGTFQRPTACMHHAGSPPAWCMLPAVKQHHLGQQTANSSWALTARADDDSAGTGCTVDRDLCAHAKAGNGVAAAAENLPAV